MEPQPLISVVIPSYNGEQELVNTVEALFRNRGVEIELIIVDNASQAPTQAILDSFSGPITVIRLPHNLGYAGAINIGLAEARGEVLMVLNDDAELDPDWLWKAHRRLQSDPRIMLVGGKGFTRDGRLLDHAGAIVEPWSCLPWHIGHNETAHWHYDEGGPTDYVCGAAMAFRRSWYEAIGPMEASYFMYFEEIEYCLDARRLGYLAWYDPELVVYHNSQRCVGGDSPLYFFFIHRSRLRYMLRNHSWRDWWRWMPAELGVWLGPHRLHHAKWPLLKAYVAILLDLPDIARKRREHFQRLWSAPERLQRPASQ